MKHKGVKCRNGKIQIKFCPPGETDYSYKTLEGWPDTPQNRAKASQLREEIRLACKFGTFRWTDYFPDDPRASNHEAGTFHHYAQEWLNNPENDWTERTRYKYLGILERIWNPGLHDRRIDLITYSHITQTLADSLAEYKEDNKKEPSTSTYNDWLTCIRGPFSQAEKDGAIIKHRNPCSQISNKTRPSPLPDPFDMEEAEEIIAAFYDREAPEHAAYVEFCFFSGVRTPSEPTALLWPEISLRNNEVRICRKRTKNGIEDGSKTGNSRIIDLNDRSKHALKAMQKISGFKNEWVFVHKEKGTPMINVEPLQDTWKRTLRHLKIRYRPMYNMRHSYACYYLEKGCSPGYLSNQMGNSLKEFFRSFSNSS